MTSRSKDQGSENNVINGACANPRLALWLLDLFAYVTCEYPDRLPDAQAAQLRSLRPHLFSPLITGLIFEVIPVIESHFRIGFLGLISSLLMLNKNARKAGTPELIVPFQPSRFVALKNMMIQMYNKAGGQASDFLRSLIELNVSIEDQVQAQEAESQPPVVSEKKSKEGREEKVKEVEEEKKSPTSSGHRELFWPMCQFSNEGDKNGVVAFIGSGCGLKKFSNPVKDELININVSANRSGLKLQSFVEPSPPGSDTYIEGTSGTKPWFQVNLGNWYVRPYCYKLKHNADDNGYLRGWNLEGSSDGGEWEVLLRHQQDKGFKTARQGLMWPIFMTSTKTYNNFRIVMTSPNSDGNWKLQVGAFDVYTVSYTH